MNRYPRWSSNELDFNLCSTCVPALFELAPHLIRERLESEPMVGRGERTAQRIAGAVRLLRLGKEIDRFLKTAMQQLLDKAGEFEGTKVGALVPDDEFDLLAARAYNDRWDASAVSKVTADVKAGEALTRANVRSVRPGNGLPPADLDAVLGRPAARDLTRGEPLAWDMLA